MINGINGFSTLYHATPFGGIRPEWFYVNHHLGKAGLVELDGEYSTADSSTNLVAGTHYPFMHSPRGGGTGFDNGYKTGIMLTYENNNRVQGHYFRMRAARFYGSASYVVSYAGLHPATAKQFDTKFDDGKAVTGAVQIAPIHSQCPNDIYDTSNTQCQPGGVGATAVYLQCALDTTEDYDLNYNHRVCAPRVKAGF